MLDPERVVTFDRVDGLRVLERLGSVRGEAVVHNGFFRATFRTLGQIVGLGPAEFLTDAERCRTSALEELQAEAERLGADAVLGVRFDAIERADGSTRVEAFGEAVRLDFGSEGAGA